MKKNILKKALIILLTCAMSMTLIGQTNTVNAEDPQNQLTGETIPEQKPVEETVPQEPTEPEVEKKRDPQDITKSEDIFSLGIKGARYQQVKKEEVVLSSKENQLDLSTMPLDVESIILQFMMTPGSDPLKAEIIKGDTFSIALPKETITAIQDASLQELKQGEDIIAQYTIVDNIINVTFNKDIDKEAFTKFATILEIPVKLNQEVITTQTPNIEMTLQNKAITTLILPKKKEEEKKKPVVIQPAKPKEEVATTTVAMEKEWRDNNAKDRPVQELIEGTDVTIGGDTKHVDGLNIYFEIKNGTDVLVGNTTLTKDNMNQIGLTEFPKIKYTNSGTSHTHYYVEGLPTTATVGDKDGNITYSLSEDYRVAQKLGYYREPNQGGDTAVYNIKAKTFSVKLAVKAGAEHLDPTTLTKFKLYNDAGVEFTKGGTPVYDSETGTYSIPNVPMYTREGKEIVYHLKADVPTDKTKDWYLPEYDNTAVANHGTNTTECYDGGTINLTLTGTTSYKGTKTWLDDHAKADERPDGTLYLWRYTDKDTNGYAQASQVRDDDNNIITLLLDKTKDSYTFIVGKDSTTGKDVALPKYDAEGYPYVYLMREIMNGGSYKQVFGEVSQKDDGTFETKDTLPVNVKRDGTDGSLYNGGTLSNLRTGSTTAKTEKTWRAATYQSQLNKVEVTMTLQKRVKGLTPEASWTNTTTTETLTGFIAEIMTMKAEAGSAKYDELGRELEYQWIETSITEDGEELLNKDGTFRLACNSEDIKYDAGETVDEVTYPDGKKDVEWFKSEVEKIDEKDPSKGTRVVNKLEGTLDYTVDKTWYESTGTDGKKNYGKNAPKGANIEITIFQNDKEYKTYTMDGTVDKIDTDNKENSPWHLYINDLPKYDDEGSAYTYVAEETKEYTDTTGTLWKASTKQIDGERRTEIKNDPTGPGNLIRVQKKWIDDSDVEHRYPVAVNVYAKTDTNQENPINTEPVILSTENNWWTEVSVPDDGTTYVDYSIKEVSLNNQWLPVTDINGTPLDPSDDYTAVTTDQHKYEVTYGLDTEKERLTVTNRRIGIINLDVTKKWIDQGQDISKDNNQRPDAKLILKSIEHPESINTTNNTVIVNLGNDKESILKIQDNSGNSASAVQVVDKTTTSGTEKTYYFHNLPKYDGEGKVIHYSVEEEKTDPTDFNKKEYQISINEKEYTVGDIHSDDHQKIEVTNKRTASKDIKYHKEWLDAYAYSIGKRPDIYLTLWKMDSTNKDPQKIGFKNYLWTSKEGSSDTINNWTADFTGMPKYDKNGQEIIYYAQESTNGDASDFDYLETKYKDSTGNQATEENGGILKYGDINLLKEEGTFVNDIENDVIIKGKKVWKNIPNGFPHANLPQIKVYVDQYLEGKTSDVPITKDIATTEDLVREGTSNEYTFEITVKGDNPSLKRVSTNKLPKYNNKGEKFEYKVREEIIEEKPAGLTSWDQVYNFQDNINGFEIENVYESETGIINVKKTLVDIPEDFKKNMAVTFELHRYKEGTTDVDENFTQTQTIHYNEYTYDKTAKTYSKEVVFDKIPVYLPDGNKYEYFVTEKVETEDGFKTEVTNGTKAVPGSVYQESSSSEKIQLMPEETVSVNTNQVDFKNTYVPSTVEINGSKVWNDYSNVMGLRPNSIQLEVWREAPAQSGEGNAIGKQQVTSGSYQIEWSGTTDTWTYRIYNLDRYAPNNEEWIYYVKEIAPEHYNQGKPIEVSKKTVTDKEGTHTITMKDLTNKFQDIKVEKTWSDSGNNYNLRPASFTVKLQVKIGDGEFQDASTYFGNQLDDKSTDGKPYAFERIITGKTTETFENLPDGDKDKKTLTYRVVETKVGDDVVWDDKAEYVKDGTHNYIPTGVTEGLTTKITNTLKATTTLKVTKNWNDSLGIYDSRPMNGENWTVTFKLQRKLKEGTEDTWQDVKKSTNDQLVTVTVTGKRNSENGVKEFTNLPKFEETSGKEYVYRAVETTNLNSYQTTSNYPTDNETVVTNTLDAMKVSVEKKWGPANITTSFPKVAFELQYSTDGTKWNSFSEPAVVILDGKADTSTTTMGETTPWQATWTGLPKKKGNIEMQYRAVEVETKTPEVIPNTPSGYWKTNGGISEIIKTDNGTSEITNTLTAFSLDKVDKNDSAKKVNNVTLAVYKKTDFTKPLFEWARDASGTITITLNTITAPTVMVKDNVIYGLPQGEYVLKETKTPDIYAKADDITFTIKDDGTLSSETENAISSDLTNGIVLTMVDRLAYGHVSLTKDIKDGKDGNVEGVVFNLYRSDESLVANGITTDKDGKWTSVGSEISQYNPDGDLSDKHLKDGLEVGHYYFEEVSTTDNTFLSKEKWEFEIRNTNDYTDTNTPIAINITNDAYVSKVVLTKKGDDGSLLEGVTFALYNKDDSMINDNLKTDKDGQIIVTNLKKGDYYFKEKATLDNYLLDNTTKYEFTLDETDTTIDKNTIKIDAINTSFVSYLQLTKKDSTDQSIIPNTEFTLYKKDTSDKFVKTDNVEMSNAKGVVKFTIHEKGTYKIIESQPADGYEFDNGKPYETKEYVIENTNTFQEKTYEFGNVENTRKTGSVMLTKVDGDDQSQLNGVVFSLYRKDNSQNVYLGDFETGKAYTTTELALTDSSSWLYTDANKGVLNLAGLPWGHYFLQEKTGLSGYEILDKQYEFTIGKDGDSMKLAEDLGTIENHKTIFSFDKMGLYVEECSDKTLGSESPDAKLPLADVEFTVYSDRNCKNMIMNAKSEKNGKVTFVGLPIGTHYMMETGTPKGYVPNKTLYKVIINKDGSTSLEDANGKVLTEIINDVYRSDISLKKVSKTNPNKVLANSLYGLYRRNFKIDNTLIINSGLQLVATSRTDQAGILTFKGVLMNENYVIQELEATDGSQVSENPISLSFHVKDGVVLLDQFDDGKGTAYLDENKQIVWKEPQVNVCFEKKDEKGNLLAGATLQVEDKDGNIVIDPWISNQQKGVISEGKLVAGKTYRLVEVKAPDGFLMSKDVEFTVEKIKVSPDEDYVQYVEMTDQLKPVVPNESTHPKEPTKTGDSTNIGMLMMLQVASIGTILGVAARKRKKKQKN